MSRRYAPRPANASLDLNCTIGSIFSAAVAACETAVICAETGDANLAVQANCVVRLDCLNNGGTPVLTGSGIVKFCATGTCSDNGALCSDSNLSLCANPGTASCDPIVGCDAEDFANYPDSPAGSSRACNAANGTPCNIWNTSGTWLVP